MSILGQARKRLEDSGVLSSSQRTLPELYGVDNYASLPGVQAHAQFATQAGHALPTDYEGKPVELAEATIMSLCTVRGGTWDPSTNSCILPEAGAVSANDLIRSSDDGSIQQAINHVGLYPGVTPGQSSVTVADIKQIPTLGAGDVWGAEIFKPGSSQMGTDYTPWDPEIAQYNQDQGGYLFNQILGSGIVPGGNILSNVLGLPSEAPTRPSSTIGTNKYGSKVSIGGGIGQVDAGLAQAAGYDNTGRPTPTVTPSRSSDRDPGPSGAERAAAAARNSAANRAASKAVKEQQSAGRTESISQKISRGGGFAAGGKVGYYEYGGANKATHPGEPRGSDTVPAWLTEGEYVADKDSTDVFEPVLKAINDWEPGMPYDEVLRAMDEFIKMTNNGEMDDAVYKQFGGFINNLLGNAGQTPTLQRDLRNRALQARDARVRGSLLQGGLGAQSAANRAQSQLIRGQAPTARGLESLGQGLAGRADAEAQYQQELGDISQAEFDREEAERLRQEGISREDQIREEKYKREDEKTAKLDAREKFEATKKLDDAKAESLRYLNDALSLVEAAGPAGDIVNGYTNLEGDAKSAFEQITENIGAGLRLGAAAVGLEEDREKILINYANSKYPGSYDAYSRLVTAAKNLVKPLIASGILGRTSDGDIKFATETIFDPTQPSSGWREKLEDAIARVKGISIVPAKLDKEVPPVPPAQQETVGETVHTDQAPAGGATAVKPTTTEELTTQVDTLLDRFKF